jgi:hypothetical protein
MMNERKIDSRYFCVSETAHNGPILFDYALKMALASGARVKDPTIRPQW